MEIKLPEVASRQEFDAEPGRIRIWFHRNRDAVVAWTFLAPMLVYFSIMTFVPMIFLIAVSFTNWNLISPPTWAGLDNLKIIFSDYQDWFYLKVIGRTVLYGVIILAINIVGGFFVALVLNQNIRFKGLFRTLWYLPGVFSGVI